MCKTHIFGMTDLLIRLINYDYFIGCCCSDNNDDDNDDFLFVVDVDDNDDDDDATNFDKASP